MGAFWAKWWIDLAFRADVKSFVNDDFSEIFKENRMTVSLMDGDRAFLDMANIKYRTRTEPVRIGDFWLDLLTLAEDDDIVRRALERAEHGERDLPYLTKVWPACLLLSQFMAGLEPIEGRTVVELGCGLGLVGLTAAARGHRVILTDIDTRALELARASAVINNLTANTDFMVLDWRHPCLGRPVDVFVGCEILYQPEVYPVLASMMRRFLAPDGRIYMAHSRRPFSIGFFKLIQDDFMIRHKEFTVRSEDEDHHISIYDIRFKQGAAMSNKH